MQSAGGSAGVGEVADLAVMGLHEHFKRVVEATPHLRVGANCYFIISRGENGERPVLSPVLDGEHEAYVGYINGVLKRALPGNQKERDVVSQRFREDNDMNPLTNAKGYSIVFKGAFIIGGHTKGSPRELTMGHRDANKAPAKKAEKKQKK